MTLLNTESFKPLSAETDARPRDDFRVSVAPASAESRPFLELDQRQFVVETHAAKHKHCEPRVSVVRDGQRVTHIQIQCGCGQLIELACAYDEPAGNV